MTECNLCMDKSKKKKTRREKAKYGVQDFVLPPSWLWPTSIVVTPAGNALASVSLDANRRRSFSVAHEVNANVHRSYVERLNAVRVRAMLFERFFFYIRYQLVGWRTNSANFGLTYLCFGLFAFSCFPRRSVEFMMAPLSFYYLRNYLQKSLRHLSKCKKIYSNVKG